jgi:3'(2'), 5'-bisphosphate nucleotidase
MGAGSVTDAELAAELAEAAGRVLVELYGSGLTGSELGAEADMRANRAILDRLNTERPDDGVLSEESNDTTERLGKSRVWIVDPLDGTREYREVRVDWAVHVALAVEGAATDGAVALPALDRVLRSDQPIALTPSHDIPRLVVSRTRPPAQALTVAEALGADLVEMGSAGAKAMAVVLGEAEIYLHAGGQYEWDNCAPVAVARAHGLHCSRLDGSPMRYNNADPYLPDLLICRPEWAERVLAIVANG